MLTSCLKIDCTLTDSNELVVCSISVSYAALRVVAGIVGKGFCLNPHQLNIAGVFPTISIEASNFFHTRTSQMGGRMIGCRREVGWGVTPEQGFCMFFDLLMGLKFS